MAAYTITTSSEQEALISWIVAEYNREHDVTFTNAQYIALRFGNLLEPFNVRYKAALTQKLKDAYVGADSATQQQVKSLLGLP